MDSAGTRALDRNTTWISIIMGVAGIVRLVVLPRFDLVTFDGTYYINQALALAEGRLAGGTFPVGYPAAIAAAVQVLRNGQAAATVVSLVAGVAVVLLVYRLARSWLGRWPAVVAALAVALNPLAIRLSVLTFSESIYIAWLLLGLVLFERRRYAFSGLSMGAAVLTRPEALLVAVLVCAARWRQWRSVLPRFGPVFAILYAVNVLTLSALHASPVLFSRQSAIESLAEPWQLRELATDSGRAGLEQAWRDEQGSSDAVRTRGVDAYFVRLAEELLRVGRHMLPVFALLALAGIIHRGGPLLAALAPLLLLPVFTDNRGDPRWIFPYVPVLFIYGVAGIEAIRRVALRRLAYGIGAVTILVNPIINIHAVHEAPNVEYAGSKAVGHWLRDRISRGDRIADRKPFVAFYAGGIYTPIPLGPYDEVFEWLVERDVRYLSLHAVTTPAYRPALAPLLYDDALIRGEMRFVQRHVARTGEMVYERVRRTDPLTWQRVAANTLDGDAPQPHGARIAFQRASDQQTVDLFVLDTERNTLATPAHDVERGRVAWSSDGTQIALVAERGGNTDVWIADPSGDGLLRRVTRHPSRDWSPSWAANPRVLAFCSERSGYREVWILDPSIGTPTAVPGTLGTRQAAISPSGRRLALVDSAGAFVVLDRNTGDRVTVPGVADAGFGIAWHPAEHTIAIDGAWQGGRSIYLVRSDGRAALVLTKPPATAAAPAWHGDGIRLVVTSNHTGNHELWWLGGLDPYIERLRMNERVATFPPPIPN